MDSALVVYMLLRLQDINPAALQAMWLSSNLCLSEPMENMGHLQGTCLLLILQAAGQVALVAEPLASVPFHNIVHLEKP